MRGLGRPLVAGAVAFGVVVRVVILAGPLGRPDADELVSGIMARNVLEGGPWPTFFAGQEYGGTAELLPVALSMRLFGSSVWALRVPTILLAVAGAVLLWRLARRIVDEGTAQLAGLLLWVGPPLFVWFGLREQLFYPLTVVLGLLAVLSALRARDGNPWSNGGVVGLCAGVGWWTSPNIAYFALPLAVAVLWDVRARAQVVRTAKLAVAALPAAVVGAWPWIAANRASGWASLGPEAIRYFPVTGTYTDHLRYFATEALPGAAGVRALFTHDWIGGPVGLLAYLALLVLLGLGAWRALPRTPWDLAGLLAYPLVFARIPFVMDQPNFRYVFFVAPFLASLVARAVTGRRALAALAVTAAVTTLGMALVYGLSERDGTRYRVGAIGDTGLVVDALEANGVAAVYGDYWVAYPILFGSDGRVAATPAWGLDRDQGARTRVMEDPNPAWVVVADSGQERALTTSLAAHGIGFTTERAGEFTIVRTDRAVRPWDLPDDARHLAPGAAPPRN